VVPPLAQVQPVPAIETSVSPDGAVSVTVTTPLVEAAPASLLTVTKYVAPVCPCVKLPVCILPTLRLGHNTVVVALPCTELLLPADTVAELEKNPQLDEVVPLVMCTDAEAPAARLPKLQPSFCPPAAPVIEHVPDPLYAGLTLQLILVPAGSGSSRATPVAVPVPTVLPLLTVTVYPI